MMLFVTKTKSANVIKILSLGIRKYLTISNGVINVYEERY
jgi:hypothetical protein